MIRLSPAGGARRSCLVAPMTRSVSGPPARCPRKHPLSLDRGLGCFHRDGRLQCRHAVEIDELDDLDDSTSPSDSLALTGSRPAGIAVCCTPGRFGLTRGRSALVPM